MKNLKIIFLSFIVINCTTYVSAKSAPTLPNSYDGTTPAARSMAMGGAQSGLPVSSEAFYYNAASLSGIKDTSFEVSAIVLKDSDASHNTVALYQPMTNGLLSAIIIKDSYSLSWSNLSDYSINQDLSKTQVSINAITLAAGRKNDRNYSIGFNLSYLYGTIAQASFDENMPFTNVASGNGFSCDLSFLFPINNNLFLGVNLKNLAGFMFWDNYSTQQLPFTIMTGLGYVYRGLTLAIDWDKRFYRFSDLPKESIHFGVEQYLGKSIALRAGTVKDQKLDKLKFTYGLGYKIKNYEIAISGEQAEIEKKDLTNLILSLNVKV